MFQLSCAIDVQKTVVFLLIYIILEGTRLLWSKIIILPQMNIHNNCYPSSRSYQEISWLVAETGLLHISLFHLQNHPLSRMHTYFKVLNRSLFTNTLVYPIILTCSYTHWFWYPQISVSFTAITCSIDRWIFKIFCFSITRNI
jgi:hypothetical protein